MKLCPRCSESFADDAGFCPFDGSELLRNADPLVGRTLAARYRLVRPLGSGGMALVYLAKHVMIERLSAIKVLRRDLAMSASAPRAVPAGGTRRQPHRPPEHRRDHRLRRERRPRLPRHGVRRGRVLARVAAPRTIRVATCGESGVAGRLGARASARARSHPPGPEAGERACHEPGRGGLRQAHRLRHRQDPRRTGADLQRAALRHSRVHRAGVCGGGACRAPRRPLCTRRGPLRDGHGRHAVRWRVAPSCSPHRCARRR